MSVKHAQNMNLFYNRKWQNHIGYWIGIYPPSAQIYALSLVKGRNDIIRETLSQDGVNILDIGCGVGDLMLLSSQKARQVIGLDIAETNVRMTRRNLENDGITNTAVLIGSAEDLPFVENFFDVIVMADVIEHVQDIEAALIECSRVLRPGGMLICTTPRAAFQTLLQFMDTVVRLPLNPMRILLGKASSRRKLSIQRDVLAYERFLPRGILKSAFLRNGMRPLKYKRICFYPGPEGGGMFGYLMAKLYRVLGPDLFPHLAQHVVTAFKTIERFQFLNQKQLWVCQKSATTSHLVGSSHPGLTKPHTQKAK